MKSLKTPVSAKLPTAIVALTAIAVLASGLFEHKESMAQTNNIANHKLTAIVKDPINTLPTYNALPTYMDSV